MLLALVDEEPLVGGLGLPPADEEMERELMGREEVPPPVAIEVPAPGEPASEERKHHHRLTHLQNQSWCNVCVRARGREKNALGTITSPARHTSHPMRLLPPEDRGRRANDHSFGSHSNSVQTDGCLLLEKKGNRDPFASRSLAAFARYIGHLKVIIQGDLDACALLTSATPRTSPVNRKASSGATEKAAQSR